MGSKPEVARVTGMGLSVGAAQLSHSLAAATKTQVATTLWDQQWGPRLGGFHYPGFVGCLGLGGLRIRSLPRNDLEAAS